jgi:hypothetical protein
MGNEYNRFNQQNLHLYPRATFLPMFCSRTSIKDVVLPRWEDRPASFSGDPLSPRIGCMGQVKRNNKVVGFPTKHNTNNNNNSSSNNYNNHNTVKYSKLKKLFSSRNLATPTSATAGCRSRRQVNVNIAGEPKRDRHGSDSCVSVSIVDMDPPLPVIKRVQKPETGEGENLWKRRSGGVALKTLQLQQIHHPKHHLQPTTV